MSIKKEGETAYVYCPVRGAYLNADGSVHSYARYRGPRHSVLLQHLFVYGSLQVFEIPGLWPQMLGSLTGIGEVRGRVNAWFNVANVNLRVVGLQIRFSDRRLREDDDGDDDTSGWAVSSLRLMSVDGGEPNLTAATVTAARPHLAAALKATIDDDWPTAVSEAQATLAIAPELVGAHKCLARACLLHNGTAESRQLQRSSQMIVRHRNHLEEARGRICVLWRERSYPQHEADVAAALKTFEVELAELDQLAKRASGWLQQGLF
jgi:hypothetical protein